MRFTDHSHIARMNGMCVPVFVCLGLCLEVDGENVEFVHWLLHQLLLLFCVPWIGTKGKVELVFLVLRLIVIIHFCLRCKNQVGCQRKSMGYGHTAVIMKLYSALCNTMDNSVWTVWLFIVLKNLCQCVFGVGCVCMFARLDRASEKWICLFMMCIIYILWSYSLKCSRTLDCYFIILYIGSCKVYVRLSFNVFHCWTQVQVSCHCSVSVQTKRIDRLSAQLCGKSEFFKPEQNIWP